ncbi:hypothetical protein M3148_16210 [Georgenia satyanarayanai]|uniref:hypothetical protein n=1 Tax=Georgenia satyanarayanai TaxID=860221 RepID=UPI00203D6EA5|nr:hypothetical protein [Georgenia satyanarayanai]MCM3662522.1 hypothetical protein [Georgenia satyanarayanai]
MSFEPEIRVPRRWLRRLVLAIVTVALVAGVVVWASGLASREQPAPAPAGPTAEPDPTGSAQTARVANGCLGGQAVNAQTVLLAQDQAPLDDVGAAEFAATLARWGGGEGGLPPADEVPVVLDTIAAPDASDSVMGLAEHSEEIGSGAERQGPATSTVEGGYYIESSTEHEVVVSVLTVDTEPAPNSQEVMAGSVMMTLDRSSGGWLLVDFGGSRELEDLVSIMTPFSGGC